MRTLRRTWIRFAALLGRGRREREMAEEFDSHFALHVDDNLRRGLSREAAVREARLKFGGVDSAREAVRDASRLMAFERMWQDLRYGFRGWRRNPGFAAAAILSLALGIGASIAIFTLTDNLLLRPLPYRDAGRLTMVWEVNPFRTTLRNVISPANYFDWKARNRVFDAMAVFAESRVPLSEKGRAEELVEQYMSAGLLPMLGVEPMRGRIFGPADDLPRSARVVLISYRLWQGWFGGDEAILGRQIHIGSTPATVIGIMPPGFYFRNRNIDVWEPLGLDPARDYRAKSGRYLMCVAHLRPGVTVERAQSEMEVIGRRLEQEFPVFDKNWGIHVEPFRESLVTGLRASMLALLGAVGLLLAVACANVANLLLARYASRRREIAARMALGAGRGRLARQLITESVALGLTGGLLGVALARWIVLRMLALAPADLTRNIEIAIDYRIVIFAAGISILTGIVFGLAPGLLAARVDLMPALREDSRSVAGGGRLRSILVAGEVALSVILLAGAGLLFRSVVGLQAQDPGLKPSHVLTFSVQRAGAQADRRVQFFARAQQEIGRLPGVVSASAISYLPFTGDAAATDFDIAGRPPAKPGEGLVTVVRTVVPGFFSTMGIPLKSGRDFTQADNTSDQPLHFVVNETFVQKYFAHEDPFSQRISVAMNNTNPFGDIIGVVGDVKEDALDKGPEPTVYYVQARLPYSGMVFVVKTGPAPLSFTAPIRRVFHNLDPSQPVARFRTMDTILRETFARQSFSAVLLAGFSAAALLLAAIGIYGVLAYAVTERTREIGVRVALGASPAAIVALVLRSGMAVVLAGAVAGIAGALALTGLLRSLLFGIGVHDTAAFAAAPAVLLAVALVAAWLPARRAARVQPVDALRAE